MNFKSMF